MEYIEFNPIAEVESSEEDVKDLPTKKGSIYLDDASDIETPFTALLRPDMAKAKFEFSRQDSYKPLPAAIDTFPNIRGLEFEAQKSPASGDSPKVFSRRASSFLKAHSDSFRLESEKEAMTEDLKMNPIDLSIEKSFNRGVSKRGKTLNALDNLELLKSVINGKITSPENMLLTAIGTFYDVDIAAKKKDNKLLDLALTVLDQILFKYNRIISYQDDLNEDLKRLQCFLAETLDQYNKIEDEMNMCKSIYQENRNNNEIKLKSTHHKIYVSINTQEKLNYSFKETFEELERLKEQCFEAEERWKMNNEDLKTQLSLLNKEKEHQLSEFKSLSNLFQDIKSEKNKQKILKKKINASTEILSEAVKYLNDLKLKKDFTLEFTELLKELEGEITQTRVSQNDFQDHALTDPKTKFTNHLSSELVFK